MNNEVKSSVFDLETLELTAGPESILRGGRSKFRLLPAAFEGLKKIAVVGWGSQAPAQAQNGRDSLKEAGSDITVMVALRPDSEKFPVVRLAGFKQEDGTLGTIDEIVPQADMVVLLITDEAQTKLWRDITAMMKAGSTLVLSHGFLMGYLDSIGEAIRDDINIILVAPKGMGPSLRKLYIQSRDTEGAGINSSVAVEQDVNGRALDYALGWSVAIGSPVTFFTSMENEWKSDLTGERCILLAALWGLAESLYEYFLANGKTPREAFLLSTKGLTSTVTQRISEHGLLGLYRSLTPSQKNHFENGFLRAYWPARELVSEIYQKVASGEEIAAVIEANAALAGGDMPGIETSDMWRVGADLYEADVPMSEDLAFTAGMYVATILAQMHILREECHNIAEIICESLIEAADSLSPFMDKRGVAFMVDNCSRTARLGTRKWGPRWKAVYQKALETSSANGGFGLFIQALIHEDIDKLFALRPTTKIAV